MYSLNTHYIACFIHWHAYIDTNPTFIYITGTVCQLDQGQQSDKQLLCSASKLTPQLSTLLALFAHLTKARSLINSYYVLLANLPHIYLLYWHCLPT